MWIRETPSDYYFNANVIRVFDQTIFDNDRLEEEILQTKYKWQILWTIKINLEEEIHWNLRFDNDNISVSYIKVVLPITVQINFYA